MKNLVSKKDFHAAPFHLILVSLKQLSHDISTDITVKQNIWYIWHHVIFVKLRISKKSIEEGHGEN